MKKSVILLIAILLTVICLVSCEWFTKESDHEHTWKYVQYETGHFKQYTCGCPSPDIFGEHCDSDADLSCDICDYDMSNVGKCDHQWDAGVEVESGTGAYAMEYTCLLCGSKHKEIITIIPPEGNYFIRNQVGAEWLSQITADDIAEIKMISGGGGPLPPVSFTHISSSTDKAVISNIFEEYYWLDSKPVSEEKTQIADGGYFVVQFVLNNGEVKELHFINGDFYHDGNGNYFEIVRLPVFRDGTNFVTRYGLEILDRYGQIYLVDGTAVCQIPVSELEFIELTDDIYLGAEIPTHYIEINGEKIYFLKDEYFYIGDDRSAYYQLVGKNLDQLIADYTVVDE